MTGTTTIALNDSWAALKEQATLAQRSGLLPKTIDTPEKAIVISMYGRELGLSPMAALLGLYVVNGVVTVRSGLMLRLIYERCPGARITVLTQSDKSNVECEVEMQRRGGNAQRFKFTLDDAKRAGFMGKQVWQQHTATMLRWAAIRTGARIVFADAISGVYLEDEVGKGEEVPEAAPELIEVPHHEYQVLPPKELPKPESEVVKHHPQSEIAALAKGIGKTEADLAPLVNPQDRKHIFEAAEIAGVSKEELMAYIDTNFGVRTTNALTKLQFNKLIAHLNVLIEQDSKADRQSTNT